MIYYYYYYHSFKTKHFPCFHRIRERDKINFNFFFLNKIRNQLFRIRILTVRKKADSFFLVTQIPTRVIFFFPDVIYKEGGGD